MKTITGRELQNKEERYIISHRCAYCYGESFRVITIFSGEKDDPPRLFLICTNEECVEKQKENLRQQTREKGEEFDEDTIPHLSIFTLNVDEIQIPVHGTDTN